MSVVLAPGIFRLLLLLSCHPSCLGPCRPQRCCPPWRGCGRGGPSGSDCPPVRSGSLVSASRAPVVFSLLLLLLLLRQTCRRRSRLCSCVLPLWSLLLLLWWWWFLLLSWL